MNDEIHVDPMNYPNVDSNGNIKARMWFLCQSLDFKQSTVQKAYTWESVAGGTERFQKVYDRLSKRVSKQREEYERNNK